jgi:hypothetical protein
MKLLYVSADLNKSSYVLYTACPKNDNIPRHSDLPLEIILRPRGCGQSDRELPNILLAG